MENIFVLRLRVEVVSCRSRVLELFLLRSRGMLLCVSHSGRGQMAEEGYTFAWTVNTGKGPVKHSFKMTKHLVESGYTINE